MKKIAIMLLAALMLFAFVACDNTGDEPNADWDIDARLAQPKDTNNANKNHEQVESVAYAEGTITVTGDLAKMTAVKSEDPAQEGATKKFVGILVSTGVEDIKTVKYNGTAFVDQDITDRDNVLGVDGEGKTSAAAKDEFVLWIDADAVKAADKTFTIERDGAEKATVTVKFVDKAATETGAEG